MKRMGRALLCGVFVLGISMPAAADVESSRRTKDGYLDVFKDDLVNSDVSFPSGIGIRVRPNAYRVTLIRPRASFVWELLKSIEKM